MSLLRVTAFGCSRRNNGRVKQLWTERRALWVDAVIAVAGVASLQHRALDSTNAGWPFLPLWLKLLLMVLPLLIAVRRITPAIAVPGLLFGAYLAEIANQPKWVLLGGAVLALWSLAGRCRVPTALSVTGATAALLMLLEVNRLRLIELVYPYPDWIWQQSEGPPLAVGGRGISEYFREVVLGRNWPRWQILLIVAVALLFLLIRRRRAQTSSLGEQWLELRAFLRGPADVLRIVLLAAGFATLILTELAQDVFRGNWWSAPGWMPYGLALAAFVLVLRRWPAIPVVVLAAGALIVNYQAGDPIYSYYGAFALALYWLITVPKADRSLRWTLPTAVGVLVILPVITWRMRFVVMQYIFPRLQGDDLQFSFGVDGIHNVTYEQLVENRWPLTYSLLFLLPVAAGVAMRFYRRNRAATEREAELEQQVEVREAEQVVLTERAVIARDLHDVVAHAVNLMVIQAETGPDLIRRGEDDVLAGFQRIGDAGRRALSELDRLLSALRDEDGIPDPQLAPQPGLADLSQLVTDVADERLTIELDLDGDLTAPPEGQQVTAYRLVQEALTNVVKHAKASAVRVTVRIKEAGVRVEVTDDGIGFDVAAAGRGNRHGLPGMRERVRIEGGTLDIRSTPGAGTTVAAWIPVGGR
ncbi:hypothetical protein GCM10009534_09470 [Kribbella sandramycini]